LSRKRREGNRIAGVLKKASLVILVSLVLVLGVSMTARLAREAPSHGKISVEVLNGCGIQGLGARTRALLRDQDFDVIDVSNAERFDYLCTIALDRTGDISRAREVINALGRGEAVTQVTDNNLAEVTLILGKDSGSSVRGPKDR
jgi:hypothetical protein